MHSSYRLFAVSELFWVEPLTIERDEVEFVGSGKLFCSTHKCTPATTNGGAGGGKREREIMCVCVCARLWFVYVCVGGCGCGCECVSVCVFVNIFQPG